MYLFLYAILMLFNLFAVVFVLALLELNAIPHFLKYKTLILGEIM